jgi:hypothetical protein
VGEDEGSAYQIVSDGSSGVESLSRQMAQIVEELAPGESLQDYVSRRDEVVGQHVSSISSLVTGFDAFDILDLMRQRETPFTLTGYSESQHDGLAAAIEVVALILLARGSRAPSISEPDDPAPNGVIEQLHHHASVILQVCTFAALAEADGERYGRLTRLASELRCSELNVRYKQYAHIHDRINHELFSADTAGDLLSGSLGFAYEEFLIAREAIREIYLDGMEGGFNTLAEVTAEWEATGQQNQDAAQVERGKSALQGLFFFPGARASFTADDLARRTEVDVLRIGRILDLFSVNFAGTDAVESVQQFLSGESPFIRASLIRDDEGNFVTLSVAIGTDCFRHVVEEALKGTSTWDRYDRHRTRVSEGLSVEYLEKILKAKATYTQFKYYAPKKDIDVSALDRGATKITSLGNEVEADALFIIEDVAICVEVKGRSISDAAKRGHVRKLTSDLERTIGDATSQARRLESLIEQNRGLWLADRTWLDLDHVREIRSIAVCLDDMGSLATALDELVRGDVIKDDRFPWIVSIHDLAVVALVLDRAAEFLLYLRRRTEPDASRRFRAIDELDLFMYFLKGGLYVEPDPDQVYKAHPTSGKPTEAARKRYADEAVIRRVHTHTNPLDAWIYLQEGSSTAEVDKPRFPSNDKVIEIVDFLQDGKKPGWFRFAADLLNLSADAQERLAAGIEHVVKSTRADHGPHSMMACYAGAWGFPALFVCSRPQGASIEESGKRMAAYVLSKAHQLQSDRALGILVDEASNIVTIQYANTPPNDDPELDALGKAMGLTSIEDMTPAEVSVRRGSKRSNRARKKRRRR